jgi:hypothetical protein
LIGTSRGKLRSRVSPTYPATNHQEHIDQPPAKPSPCETGLRIIKNRQTDITNFNLERARLAFVFPTILICSGLLAAYGWQMQYHTPLAPILITMFLIAILLPSVMIATAALLTDLNRENAAAIGAAMNLTRLLLSAGAVAVVGPLDRSVGIGWTATITAGAWILLVPVLGIVYRKWFA